MLARTCAYALVAVLAAFAWIASLHPRARADDFTVAYEEGPLRWRLGAAAPRPTCAGRSVELVFEAAGALALCVHADDSVEVEHARLVQGDIISHVFEGSGPLDARHVRVERDRDGEVRALRFARATFVIPHRSTRPASFTGVYTHRTLRLDGTLRVR